MPKRVAALAVAALAAAGWPHAGIGQFVVGGSADRSPASRPPGGTLRIVATAGPDHIDTVPAYYTADYMLERAYARQLLTYPYAVPTSADERRLEEGDHAGRRHRDRRCRPPRTAAITNGGKTYTFHIRSGVDWNTSPPRQVTASDFIREFKAFCNPVQPGRQPAVLPDARSRG